MGLMLCLCFHPNWLGLQPQTFSVPVFHFQIKMTGSAFSPSHNHIYFLLFFLLLQVLMQTIWVAVFWSSLEQLTSLNLPNSYENYSQRLPIYKERVFTSEIESSNSTTTAGKYYSLPSGAVLNTSTNIQSMISVEKPVKSRPRSLRSSPDATSGRAYLA